MYQRQCYEMILLTLVVVSCFQGCMQTFLPNKPLVVAVGFLVSVCLEAAPKTGSPPHRQSNFPHSAAGRMRALAKYDPFERFVDSTYAKNQHDTRSDLQWNNARSYRTCTWYTTCEGGILIIWSLKGITTWHTFLRPPLSSSYHVMLAQKESVMLMRGTSPCRPWMWLSMIRHDYYVSHLSAATPGGWNKRDGRGYVTHAAPACESSPLLA